VVVAMIYESFLGLLLMLGLGCFIGEGFVVY
jgi:hypothetical protein